MIKSKEVAGPSCLTSAADDEPIFVLKSTDELAPEIVRRWAFAYRAQKNAQPGGMTPKQAVKYHEAISLATDMEAWRAGLVLSEAPATHFAADGSLHNGKNPENCGKCSSGR